MLRGIILAMFLMAFTGSNVWAQSDTPIVSGGLGFLGSTNGGATNFQPVIAPVVTVPLGDKWLIEARADLRGFVARDNGTTGPYQGQFFGTLEYLQLDYNATSWLTITAGRFLTPFGIFNERISAIWINKFESAPMIDPIGTAQGYSQGFMTRGTVVSRTNYSINYIAYFSTLSKVSNIESERSAGGRVGIFFPQARLEIGTSYQHLLQGARTNSEGLDVSWEPYRVPLDLKGEWAHSPSGEGYWLQAAYRLSQLGGPNSALGRLEPVFRMQQFFRSQLVSGDFLPATNTREPDFGLNYYLPHEVRLHAAYSRQLVEQRNANLWEFGVTYRFLFPMWPGGGK
ncbi:MAG: hypothetical protein WAN14_10035 [Candidatus Acidiferrales bacterium]